jgi:hypothetical protein
LIAELVDHLYPTNQKDFEADCLRRDLRLDESAVPAGGVPLHRAMVDEMLAMVTDSAQRLGPAGLRPIPTYARMPEYRRGVNAQTGEVSCTPIGRQLNFIDWHSGR